MPTIQDVVAQVQIYMATLPDIRSAPANPPESVNAFPFVVTLPHAGNWESQSAAWKRGLHAIVIDVHVARKDAPRDYQKFVPFVELVPNLLFNKLFLDKWSGLIDTFRSIAYTTTTFDYAGTETVGLRFTVNDIKMQSAIT